MAPINASRQSQHNDHNMSSPTSKLLLSRSRTSDAAPSSFSNMKTANVGKDFIPVTFMALEPVSEPSWKKAACFDSLKTAALGLVDSHPIYDIISFVGDELPLDSIAALQEAGNRSMELNKSIFDVNNLTPSAFLSFTGKVLPLDDFNDLDKRPENVSFFRVKCDLQGHQFDPRITTAGDFSFQFCLRLPLHEYDPTSKVYTTISSPLSVASAMTTMSISTYPTWGTS